MSHPVILTAFQHAMQVRDWNTAARFGRILCLHSPDDHRIWGARARVARCRNDNQTWERARHRGLLCAHGGTPASGSWLPVAADLRQQNGDLDSAIRLARQALHHDPGHPLAWTVLVRATRRRQGPDASAPWVRRARVIHVAHPEILVETVLTTRAQSNPTRHDNWRRRLLAIDPGGLVMIREIFESPSPSPLGALIEWAEYHAATIAPERCPVPRAPSPLKSPYRADNPSPRYHFLIEQYQKMHRIAEQQSDVFSGWTSLWRVLPHLRAFIHQNGPVHSLLDYGGGRGKQYNIGEIYFPERHTNQSISQFLDVQNITCWDPGRDRGSPPSGKFDMVICIDVLEHCDSADLPWIISSLFSRARRAVFVQIACYPAGKTLPNGENCHCTVEAPQWWQALFADIARNFPSIRYKALTSARANDLRFTAFEG